MRPRSTHECHSAFGQTRCSGVRDDDESPRAMGSEAPAGLECEEHQARRPLAKDADWACEPNGSLGPTTGTRIRAPQPARADAGTFVTPAARTRRGARMVS